MTKAKSKQAEKRAEKQAEKSAVSKRPARAEAPADEAENPDGAEIEDEEPVADQEPIAATGASKGDTSTMYKDVSELLVTFLGPMGSEVSEFMEEDLTLSSALDSFDGSLQGLIDLGTVALTQLAQKRSLKVQSEIIWHTIETFEAMGYSGGVVLAAAQSQSDVGGRHKLFECDMQMLVYHKHLQKLSRTLAKHTANPDRFKAKLAALNRKRAAEEAKLKRQEEMAHKREADAEAKAESLAQKRLIAGRKRGAEVMKRKLESVSEGLDELKVDSEGDIRIITCADEALAVLFEARARVSTYLQGTMEQDLDDKCLDELEYAQFRLTSLKSRTRKRKCSRA